MSRGGRNLIILSIITIIVSLAVSGVSLAIYHNSGDIYLDRSRPGFLPENTDDEPKQTEYKFEDTGPVTSEIIKEYIESFESDAEPLEIESPFSELPLLDNSLGIEK